MPCIENGLCSPVQRTRAAPLSICSRCALLICAMNSWGSVLPAVPTAPLGAQGQSAHGTFLQGVTAMPPPAQTGAGYSQEVYPRTPCPLGAQQQWGKVRGPSIHLSVPVHHHHSPGDHMKGHLHRVTMSQFPDLSTTASTQSLALPVPVAAPCSGHRATAADSAPAPSAPHVRVCLGVCVRAHGCAGTLLARH